MVANETSIIRHHQRVMSGGAMRIDSPWRTRGTSLFLIALTACASVQARPSSLSTTFADSAADYRARRDRNVITKSEMVAMETLSAYDVVMTLRRQWLSARGALTADGLPDAPFVYLQ